MESPPQDRTERVGAWLVGAHGAVATTAVTGLAAIVSGLAPTTGLATEHPALALAPLPPLEGLVVGGSDTSSVGLRKRAELLADERVIPAAVLARVADVLDRVQDEIRPGIAGDDLRRPAAAIARVRADLDAFRARHDLDRVVVVNVASTEPPPAPHPAHLDLQALRAELADERDREPVLPASALYAIAAFEAGAAFVDFTPSAALQMPSIDALARELGVPYAGRDGKTGETLVKSALAPMFAARNLRVRSWAGTNLLGGGDGATLADPEARASKIGSKATPLRSILGYDVDAPVRIDYVPDLGDWKTAWDHITFEGFLGTRMKLQFTWEGADSALAAPLVLDLVRLAGAALRAGEVGPVGALAFYFKDPLGGDDHRLAQQFSELCRWALTLPTP